MPCVRWLIQSCSTVYGSHLQGLTHRSPARSVKSAQGQQAVRRPALNTRLPQASPPFHMPCLVSRDPLLSIKHLAFTTNHYHLLCSNRIICNACDGWIRFFQSYPQLKICSVSWRPVAQHFCSAALQRAGFILTSFPAMHNTKSLQQHTCLCSTHGAQSSHPLAKPATSHLTPHINTRSLFLHTSFAAHH